MKADLIWVVAFIAPFPLESPRHFGLCHIFTSRIFGRPLAAWSRLQSVVIELATTKLRYNRSRQEIVALAYCAVYHAASSSPR